MMALSFDSRNHNMFAFPGRLPPPDPLQCIWQGQPQEQEQTKQNNNKSNNNKNNNNNKDSDKNNNRDNTNKYTNTVKTTTTTTTTRRHWPREQLKLCPDVPAATGVSQHKFKANRKPHTNKLLPEIALAIRMDCEIPQDTARISHECMAEETPSSIL